MLIESPPGPSNEDLVFRALASPLRRQLLDRLKDHPQTTGELCAAFDTLDRCTVMQHLKVLEDAELVLAVRRGRERWNHLNPTPIRDIHVRWIGDYAALAVEKLAGLRAGIES